MGHERAERAEGYEDTMQVRGPADSLLTDTSKEQFCWRIAAPSSSEIKDSSSLFAGERFEVSSLVKDDR
jgi:hypothetical protein